MDDEELDEKEAALDLDTYAPVCWLCGGDQRTDCQECGGCGFREGE